MSAPRLFIEPAWVEAGGRRVRLRRDQARYLRSVLRLSSGAPVARAAGYERVGLGRRVLRAETATLAALAILAYEIET